MTKPETAMDVDEYGDNDGRTAGGDRDYYGHPCVKCAVCGEATYEALDRGAYMDAIECRSCEEWVCRPERGEPWVCYDPEWERCQVCDRALAEADRHYPPDEKVDP